MESILLLSRTVLHSANMAFRRRKQSSDSVFSSEEKNLSKGVGIGNDMEQAPSAGLRSSLRPSESSTEQISTLSTEYKFDIASRLDESVALRLVDAPNQSPDLIPLTKSFDALRKRLRQMIATAKQYHKSMTTLDMDRLQVCNNLYIVLLVHFKMPGQIYCSHWYFLISDFHL